MTELSQVSFSVYMSPVGELLLTCERGMLTSLNMALQQGKPAPSPKPQWRRDDCALHDVRQQLDAYFAGERQNFDLPLSMSGTPFQKQVWQGLLADSLRDNHQLRRAGPPHRPPGRLARGGSGQRSKPDRDYRPVPSRDRCQRHTHRLRRRTRPEGMADLRTRRAI